MAKKTDSGFIARIREQLMGLEVSNEKYNLPRTGIKNLSEFCRIVDLDYNLVSREVNKARDNEESNCEIKGWYFSWMTIDEMRAYFQSLKIPIHVRMSWIRGRVPFDVKDFRAEDRPFGKMLLEFMS